MSDHTSIEFGNLKKRVDSFEFGKLNSDNLKEDLPTGYESIERALQQQNLEFRSQIIETINKDRESKQKIRIQLLWFYIIYTIGVTTVSFWVILGNYSNNVKFVLAGTLLVNLISVMTVMVKYAFKVEDKLIDLFKELGGRIN